MDGAGLYVESAKGECNLGQHEIAFRYADALTTADQHSIYKTGGQGDRVQARVRPHVHGQASNEREGNSCHIHLSFRDADGIAGHGGSDGQYGLSPTGTAMIGGLLAGLRELTLRCWRRRSNSYKRRSPWAASRPPRSPGEWTTGPAHCAWSGTGRRCKRREPHSRRRRQPLPGPGRAGRRRPVRGRRGADAAPAAARERLHRRRAAKGAPDDGRGTGTVGVVGAGRRRVAGADVVSHYATMARVELEAYGRAVTDWELRRYFERI